MEEYNQNIQQPDNEFGIPSYDALKAMYRTGKIKKLNGHEMALLEKCHNMDVIAMLREEFRRNPILLRYDDSGNLLVNDKMLIFQ